MATETNKTTDHRSIREWVESRGGKPARAKRTYHAEDPGALRIYFPDFDGGDALERISWDEWLAKFDTAGLAFLYQEKTEDGQRSYFNKLIQRESA
jgi:hypothetical protein